MKKLFLLFVVLSFPIQAEPLEQRLGKIERLLKSMNGNMTKFDGVVPERALVYKTAARCKDITKSKMYFDAAHPYHLISVQRCGKNTYYVVRWYDKDFSEAIHINTVLKKDVIAARR